VKLENKEKQINIFSTKWKNKSNYAQFTMLQSFLPIISNLNQVKNIKKQIFF